MNTSHIKPYSKAIVKLLKGTVEHNDSVWDTSCYTSPKFKITSVSSGLT